MHAGKQRCKVTGAALAGAIAAAALLGGCGGGGATAGRGSLEPVPTLRTSSLSKPAFVKRALAICARRGGEEAPEYQSYFRRNGLRLELSRAVVITHAAGLLAIAARAFEREVGDIGALGAPKGDERRVTAILNAIEQGVEAAEEDPLPYFFSSYGENPLHDAWVLADSYGLGPCALR